MACDASRARLSPPAKVAAAAGVRGPRKRGRSPAPAGVVRCAASGPVAPLDRRRWHNLAGGGVGRRFRPPPPPAPRRRWVGADDPSCPDRDACMIMSYNILGDNNAWNHRDLYWNIPCDVMKWDSRRRLICREIGHWDPDLVCLQEVDNFGDIVAEMRRKGYASRFKGRSGDAKDGCATFWKEKRLRLLEEDSIDFSAFNLRNNVAQIFVFELHRTQRLVLGNIHVLFNPKRGDIKLGQIRMLLVKANALSEKWGGIPIVFAGDFNSTPDSAIYKFLSTMKLNVSLHDRRHLSGLDSSQFGVCEFSSFLKYQWTDDELRNATGRSDAVVAKHPLKLRSSYAAVKGNGRTRGHHGEPVATSYHKKFLGTVDYLWYTTGLECSKVLDTVPIDILRRSGGLPTREMGSDHLPIVAEFIFTESIDLEEQEELEEETESEVEITMLPKGESSESPRDEPGGDGAGEAVTPPYPGMDQAGEHRARADDAGHQREDEQGMWYKPKWNLRPCVSPSMNLFSDHPARPRTATCMTKLMYRRGPMYRLLPVPTAISTTTGYYSHNRGEMLYMRSHWEFVMVSV